MYGIFGILNDKNVNSTLLQGLQRMENGGYDAISVATVADGRIQWQEAKDLHSLLPELSTGGRFGIAYTSKGCQTNQRYSMPVSTRRSILPSFIMALSKTTLN